MDHGELGRIQCLPAIPSDQGVQGAEAEERRNRLQDKAHHAQGGRVPRGTIHHIYSLYYIYIYIFICVYSIKLVLLEVVCILVEHGCKKYMYNYVNIYIYTHVCIYIYMFNVYTAISFRPSKAPTCGRKNGCIGYSPRQSPRLRRTWRC